MMPKNGKAVTVATATPDDIYDSLSQDGQDNWDAMGSVGYRPFKGIGGLWYAKKDGQDETDAIGPSESLSILKTMVDDAAKADLNSEYAGRNENQFPTRNEDEDAPVITINLSQRFDIPSETEFDEKQFLIAPDLKKVGERLIETYPSDFGYLVGANILYLWKAKGGESGGRETWGKCIRPTGLASFFATEGVAAGDPVDYFIWVAADHLREARANRRTVCALIFHELKHTQMGEKGYVVVGHEFEGFAREIEEFGMWQHSIKRIAEACETVKDVQRGLFATDEE
jgi:hypothetical protein